MQIYWFKPGELIDDQENKKKKKNGSYRAKNNPFFERCQ